MADNNTVVEREKETAVNNQYRDQRLYPQPRQVIEINILNIFGYMKKAKGIFIWLMIICFSVGTAVPYMWGLLKSHVDEVKALISFEYDEAGKLLTPDGRKLDVSQITSSNVIAKALKNSGLQDTLSSDTVSNNMSISRMLTEESRQKKEILKKLSESNANAGNPSEYIENVQNAINYTYKNQYVITLKNGFGNGFGNEETLIYLTGDDLSTLLNNIVAEYKDYFFETYGDFTFPDNKIDDVSLEELDYIEWLDNMVTILDSLSTYCDEMEKSDFAEYYSAKNGFSFKDINRLIKIIKSTKVDYLYSYVYYNCLAKDTDSVITKFNYSLKNLKYTIDVVNENITNGAKMIETYKINSILINRQVNGSGDDSVIRANSVTDYYNNLVLQQAEFYKEKADLLVIADDLQGKISGFSGNKATVEKIAIAENEIAEVNVLCRQLFNLVNGLAEEIAGSETFAGSYITSVDATYDWRFFSANKKNILIGVMLGVLIAGVAWCVYGFVKEVANGARKARG